ncbi:trace amine-associated receptor 1-like [Ictalurus furcatus]|uniref:trace amine-associated receptor 1-like n=1 Tax=Ictalurus furcatus TaxID=66913 RepID=UPI0023505B9F|nr:trace amine-associated receptor 1-like [Ictalurus furcatus]
MPGPAPRKRRHNEIRLAYGTPWDELMPTELDLSTPQQADKPWLVGCFSCVNGDIQKVPAAEVLDSASADEIGQGSPQSPSQRLPRAEARSGGPTWPMEKGTPGREPPQIWKALWELQMDNIIDLDIVQEPSLCFSSLNTSCLKTDYPLEVRVLLYILFSTSSLITVIGNLLVIITVVHFRQLRTSTNYLILSLAVADLLVGGMVMPPSMIRSVETCWYLGSTFCKLHSSLDVTVCTASILNLCIISLDRYYAVCHPLLYHSKMTPTTIRLMIIVCWSVSAALGFGMIFMELNILGNEEFYYNNFLCEGACMVFQAKAAAIVFPMLCFYIPAVIMLCVYMKIFRTAQRQARAIQSTNAKTKTAEEKAGMSKSERKATKTLAIIVGVFLTSWVPFFICNCLDPFTGYSVPPILFDVFLWVGYFNSTCNPIVYAFFYSWFRHAFRVILSGGIFQVNSSHTKLF